LSSALVLSHQAPRLPPYCTRLPDWNYIFGLLFLKRRSDRFEEECETLVAEAVLAADWLVFDGSVLGGPSSDSGFEGR